MPHEPLLHGAAALSHLGVIRAQGADAASFLQGQLTNDVATLDAGRLRVAGYCSAKGRLLATFWVWRADEQTYCLALPAALLPATLKRLQMFVLRAACKLADVSVEMPLWGLIGEPARELTADAAAWQRQPTPAGDTVRLPDVNGQPRALLIAPTAAPNAPALSNDAWCWAELQAGVAWIEPATVDQFVPQMLNLEVVGGVDFKKGCYPGQEVVARSQYRGTLKRRAFLFDLPAGSQAAPGQEIVDPDDPSQPVGMVVNAAARPDGHGASLLAELKLAALARADAGALRLVDANGPALQRRELAYAVPLEAQDIP